MTRRIILCLVVSSLLLAGVSCGAEESPRPTAVADETQMMPTPSPTKTSTATPTRTAAPTVTPTLTPSPTATATMTPSPTASPTMAPTSYPLTANGSSASFASWLPDAEASFNAQWLTNNLTSDDDICIYAEDETYGFTAENPMPIGNGPNFGGPFDGMNAYSFLRVAPGEAQEWIRGHTFPSNSRNDILDTLIISAEGGQGVELYVNINDYSIPQIPVGMYCDPQYP